MNLYYRRNLQKILLHLLRMRFCNSTV